MAARKPPSKTQARKKKPTHTTVRIDVGTHGRLMKMSEETGRSLGHLISDAVLALEQRRFMAQLNEDYRRMRENPEEWEAFVRERDEWLLGVPILKDDAGA